MVNRLQEAGIQDPTHEDVTCKFGGKVLKFRLYSQEQWDKMIENSNEAVKLYNKMGIGKTPDHVVTASDKVYLVKILN